MLVKDIILESAIRIGVGDKVRDVIEYRTPPCVESDLLLKCYNAVENEVALDYIPLVIEEKFETETGVIYYEQLSQKPIRIVKTKDAWDNDIECGIFPEYLKTQAGKITVCYACIPQEKTLEDESAFTQCVSKWLLVYGVLSEYCLASGLYEESAIWQKKYKDAVASVYRAKPAKRITARRWI